MGWRIHAVIVQDEGNANLDEVRKALDLTAYAYEGEDYVELALNPAERHLYLGNIKGHLVLFHTDIPLSFLEETVKGAEASLASLFPAAEITALVLNSTVNLWGFSISRGGRRVRVKSGSADTGTMIDMGEPQSEEQFLLQHASLRDGQRVYRLPDYPDEEFTEDQVGEEFVFALSERYFGMSFTKAEIMEAKLSKYVKPDGFPSLKEIFNVLFS